MKEKAVLIEPNRLWYAAQIEIKEVKTAATFKSFVKWIERIEKVAMPHVISCGRYISKTPVASFVVAYENQLRMLIQLQTVDGGERGNWWMQQDVRINCCNGVSCRMFVLHRIKCDYSSKFPPPPSFCCSRTLCVYAATIATIATGKKSREIKEHNVKITFPVWTHLEPNLRSPFQISMQSFIWTRQSFWKKIHL